MKRDVGDLMGAFAMGAFLAFLATGLLITHFAPGNNDSSVACEERGGVWVQAGRKTVSVPFERDGVHFEYRGDIETQGCTRPLK